MPQLLHNRTAEAPAGQASQAAPGRRRWMFPSAAVCAVILFLIINLCLWQSSRSRYADVPADFATSFDQAVGVLASRPEAPDIVLIGSSLVMFPFWAVDKELDPSIGDIHHHREARVLQKRLEEVWSKPVSAVNMAVFGQMVSDCFLLVNEYLKDDRTPGLIVYGLAPRDFSDYDVPAAMYTPTFKKLFRLDDVWKHADVYLPGFTDRVDFLLKKTVFFYAKRWRNQQEVNKALDRAYTFLGLEKGEAEGDKGERAGFMIFGSDEDRWASSTREYRRRYRDIADKDLHVQMGSLENMLRVCRERGIRVVLVQMPLSRENLALLPDGFYQKFKQRVADIASRGGATLVDLGADGEFLHDDFWDTAHLNHAGGKKLIDALIPVLTREKR